MGIALLLLAGAAVLLDSAPTDTTVVAPEENIAASGGADDNADEKERPVVTDPLLPDTPEGRVAYIEVIDSCDHNYDGECLVARSGPGTEHSVVARLRTGTVLRVEDASEGAVYGWYHVIFDEPLRYPERLGTDEWYVAAEYVRVHIEDGTKTAWEEGAATTTKRIVVDRTEQKLYAYEGDVLFMEADISTGERLTPTPSGTFEVFKKMPSRYMQGPTPGLPVQDRYDLPGVPWDLYFTEGGAVIHGAYWHDNFGSPHSHGCVNLRPNEAKCLYEWAPLGTEVTVTD